MVKGKASTRSADKRPTRLELVIGLVGPIGVDMDLVQNKVAAALRQVEYTPKIIHLTKLIKIAQSERPAARPAGYETKIAAANDIRREYRNDAALAALAISEIRKIRIAELQKQGNADQDNLPLDSTCFIVRQLKRKEEVELLRKVYGRKFIQISVTLDKDSRLVNLRNKISREEPQLSPKLCEEKARQLIDTDDNETGDDHGQRISEIFHLGDAFINGGNEDTVTSTTFRFIDAFFGKNNVSPNKDEFGMYLAAAASLRSIDLSRQVGQPYRPRMAMLYP